jgi:hypothetical protein
MIGYEGDLGRMLCPKGDKIMVAKRLLRIKKAPPREPFSLRTQMDRFRELNGQVQGIEWTKILTILGIWCTIMVYEVLKK